MTSSYTTNKNIEKPAYNDYATNATGWTSPVNADWDVIDRSLGGVQVMNPTGVSGSVTLTTAQYQAPIIVIGTSISGVATLTAAFVEAARKTKAKIYDTRKTLPGWRSLEKYAVPGISDTVSLPALIKSASSSPSHG